MRLVWRLLALTLLAAMLPHPARAQATGTIAGTVRDTTGAVLPGVTVEAASPALIEKVRSVVSDSQGNYKIVDLRPGTYSVTFTLTGFSTLKREGIELSAGFTATANADLKIGSLEETVTVTGASPIVDVQNARSQQVLKGEALNQLPSGAKNLMSFAAMTLGANPSSQGRNDVGGDKGEQATGIILHGGRGDDGRVNWDGMNTNVFFGNAGGQQRTYYFNTVAIQEVVVDTGGNNAESETGGANINMVPKEGANSFKYFGSAAYTNQDLSARHVPDDIKARGVTDQSSLKDIYNYGAAIGGPLRQDKAWFFGTTNWWGADNFGAGNFFNKSPSPFRYEADLTRPAYSAQFYVDTSFRVTWQINGTHKINQEQHIQHGCSCWLGIGNGQRASPEAVLDFNYGPQILSQTTWSYPRTNKLLFQAGATFLRQEVNFVNGVALEPNKFTGIGKPLFPRDNQFSILELTTGYNWGGLGLFNGVCGALPVGGTVCHVRSRSRARSLRTGPVDDQQDDVERRRALRPVLRQDARETEPCGQVHRCSQRAGRGGSPRLQGRDRTNWGGVRPVRQRKDRHQGIVRQVPHGSGRAAHSGVRAIARHCPERDAHLVRSQRQLHPRLHVDEPTRQRRVRRRQQRSLWAALLEHPTG